MIKTKGCIARAAQLHPCGPSSGFRSWPMLRSNAAGPDTLLFYECIVTLRLVRCCQKKRRQLQHGRVLAFAQLRKQNYLSIGKFESVTMNVPFAFVDLPELRHLVSGRPAEDYPLASDLLFK